MILWNTSAFPIEARYDNKPYMFMPGEKKELYEPNEISHLIYKLEDFGLVQMPNGVSADDEKKFRIEGLRKRRKMLDFRVRNFRTMNKERESAKLSQEPPSDLIIETVDEIEIVDKELKTLLADKFSKVDLYMKTQEFDDTTEKMEEQTNIVETHGSKTTIKKGGNKIAVPSSKH